MIYSLGYSGLDPVAIPKLMKDLKLDLLIDVRAKPQSRKPGFSRKALEASLGDKYAWHGDTLGGAGGGGEVLPEGLALLKKLDKQGKRIVLLCLEAKPEQCHRHHEIAEKLLPKIVVEHILALDDAMVHADELSFALKDDKNPLAQLYDIV